MKNILTIDFDIIMEPSIQFYNNYAPQNWDELTQANAYGNILIGNYNIYNKLTNFLLDLIQKVNKESIHIIFDHHDIIQFLNPNERYSVVNIDHHHDLGYPNKDHPEQSNRLNCGNWVKYVPNLQQYFWIKNTNSIPKEDEFISTANIMEYELNNLTTPDQIFICFSIPWVPPCNQPLFYLWLDILNKFYNTHFDFEKRIDD